MNPHDECDRLRLSAEELMEVVEAYHSMEWEEEPFTPDIEELRQRLEM